MAKKYLDEDGLIYLWTKIKTYFTGTSVPNMDGTGATGTSAKFAREDHVHPTDTSRAPVNHASTATTYGVGNSSNYGHVKLSDSTSATTAAASGGTAATPKAVKDALDAAKSYTDSQIGGIDAGVVSVNGQTGAVVISDATTSASGLMSSSDKSKLDGIDSGADVNVIETVKVNGTVLTPDANKAVDVTKDDVVGDALTYNISNTPHDITSWQHWESDDLGGLRMNYSDGSGSSGYIQIYEKGSIDSIGTSLATQISSKISSSEKGSANGVCPLNANSKIDSAYLPSYVDDVVEAYPRSGQTELSSTWLATGSASGTVITPETGVIYVLMADTTNYSANSQFRWSGTAYVKLNDGGVSSITNAEIDAILAA